MASAGRHCTTSCTNSVSNRCGGESPMQAIDMKTGRTIREATVVAMVALRSLSGCADKPEALVASAKEYLAKNDRNAAMIQLRNALQMNPDLAEARFLLGKSMLETGESCGREKELRKARELKYAADQVVPGSRACYVSRGEYKKMVDEFGRTDVDDAGGQRRAADVARPGANGDRQCRGCRAATLPRRWPPARLSARLARRGAAEGGRPGDLPRRAGARRSGAGQVPTLTDGWQLKGDIAGGPGADRRWRSPPIAR